MPGFESRIGALTVKGAWIRDALVSAARSGGTADAAVLAASQYGAAAIALVTTLLAANVLGPTQYGRAALTMAFPLLLWSFASVKAVSVATRYLSRLRASGQTAEIGGVCKLSYALDLGSAVLVVTVVVTTSWWVLPWISEGRGDVGLTTAYAGSLCFLALRGTSTAVLSAYGHFRSLAATQVFNKTLTLVVVGSALVSGLGLRGFVLANAAGHVLSGIAFTWLAHRVLRREGAHFWWRVRIREVRHLRSELVRFFGWNYATVTLTGLLSHFPLLMIGGLVGAAAAGYLRLALAIVNVASRLFEAAGKVVYPKLVERWAVGDYARVRDSVKRWTVVAGIPFSIFFVFTIAVFPVLSRLLFGSAYDPMIRGGQFMLAGTAVSALFFWLQPLVYSIGRVRLWTYWTAFYAMAVLVGSWLGAVTWGFNGVAAALGIGKTLFSLSLVTLVVRRTEVWK